MENTILYWLGALILFLVIEAATVGLVSIWFACGSLIALIASAFGADLWVQVVLFLVGSAVSLYFTRPLARKYLRPKHKATNADRVLNMPCIVVEDIDNLGGSGAVSVDGKIWTARSLSGELIKKDAFVRVNNIEGVKLIVMPASEADQTT